MLHDNAGLTELLPRWLAPNLITLTGTFGLILAYFVSLYYVPTFTGELQHCLVLTTSIAEYWHACSTTQCRQLKPTPQS